MTTAVLEEILFPFEVEVEWGEDTTLPIAQLIVERYEDKPGEFYQRGITHMKDKIVASYFPRAFGRITVAEVSKNKYAVVDGQNRVEAAREMGFSLVPCVVHRKLSLKQRAHLFWYLNTQARTLRPVQKFHAAVSSGDKGALVINEILDRYGIKVTEGSSGVSSLSAITTVIGVMNAYGAEMVDRTFSVISQAWPDDRKRYQNSIIGGVSQFLRLDHGTTPDEKIAARLAAYTCNDVNRQGSVLHQGSGHGGHSHIYVARGIAIFLYGGKAKNTWPEKKRKDK